MSQTVRARYDYDPYGRMTKISGDRDTVFGFTGHFWHAQSGLNLTLYRAYDPNLGRWISRDPIKESGGINLYGYVDNDPINYVDPYGLFLILVVPAAGLALALAAINTLGFIILAIIIERNWARISYKPKDAQPPPPACPSTPAPPRVPPFPGPPGGESGGTDQTRRYGPDGFPETDVDVGHNGHPDPHSHDWGRPSGGGRPTNGDRGPWRPWQPGDPPPPPNSGKP